MALQSTNPYDNKVIQSFEEMSTEQIEKKITRAHEVYQNWKHTSFATRSELIHKTAELMRQRTEELARTITLEMGKVITQARAEIKISADILDYYADNAQQFLHDRTLKVSTGDAYIKYCPIGVILGIEPWNFPFYQVIRMAAPNIMAGNTVMLKHASNVLGCSIHLEKIFRDAGVPEGVFTNLLLSVERVNQLIENPLIAGVSLTGSAAAGASVAKVAGKTLKKLVLELGGNDPFIVLDDADMDTALSSAVRAKMNNVGQSCVAAKRFIVMDKVADEFIKKFSEELSKFKPGDPLDEKTTLAPLSSEAAAVRLQKQIEDSLKMGAKALIGGSKRNGAFIAPTVLVDVKPGMPAYGEELFGPVATIFRVKTEEEATHLANVTSFGLGASVFSRNTNRAEKIAEKIDSGMVFINSPTMSMPELPFGGTKGSGYGRSLADLGILEFVNKKLIHKK